MLKKISFYLTLSLTHALCSSLFVSPLPASTMTDLTDINKTLTNTTTPVIRRFRPMSSFDEPKHMRRISYLRATNGDYNCETSLSSSSVTNTSTGSINDSLSTAKLATSVLTQQIEEHPDPIYDVVGGDSVGGGGIDSGAADSTSESLDALEDLKLETASRSSRRTSVNSDIRHRFVVYYYEYYLLIKFVIFSFFFPTFWFLVLPSFQCSH